MKPVEGGSIDAAHQIFHAEGYWRIALSMKHSGDYPNNRSVYEAIEGQLRVYGFTRHTTYESWKTELYRRLQKQVRQIKYKKKDEY